MLLTKEQAEYVSNVARSCLMQGYRSLHIADSLEFPNDNIHMWGYHYSYPEDKNEWGIHVAVGARREYWPSLRKFTIVYGLLDADIVLCQLKAAHCSEYIRYVNLCTLDPKAAGIAQELHANMYRQARELIGIE